jgi:hypothetical protein
MGKTVTGEVWLLAAAISLPPLAPWWWCAPTYAQSQHGFLGLCNMAVDAGLLRPGDFTTRPPLEARLVTGARIQGRSWDNPDAMYGPTIMGAIVDEFGQLTWEAYGALSSRRAESITWGYCFYRYLGNVGEMGGPAEELWNLAESGAPGFASRRWTWKERAQAHQCPCGNGTQIPIALGHSEEHRNTCARGEYLGFIEREAARMSSPQFRQLYDAEWVDWNQLPAYGFDRGRHVQPHADDPSLDLDLSCDFNVDPMCWTIGQHKGLEAWEIDELVLEGGATTQAAADEFVRRYADPKRNVEIYGDASGKARTTKSLNTDYEIIRTVLTPHFNEVRMSVPASNPGVGERLNAVNALLMPADGSAPRYTVDPSCKTLINDLARVSLRPGTRDLDKRNKRLTHASDAAGYRLASLYPVQVPGGITTHIRTPAVMGDSFMEASF